MKQKQSISAIKSGLNKDAHISQLNQTEIALLINGNTENETGGYNVQNEPSNRLGIRFPESYVVIGFKNDILQDKTYYFLTNPTTKKSSIGYVSTIIEDTFNQDEGLECEDCSPYNQLGEPLENQVQTPAFTYVPILNDNCLNIGEGLNFDINFPLKKIEIKQEKLGTYLYWNDNRNPPRWMNVSDTSYLFTQEIPCEDNVIVTCPLLDKLLIFPKHNKLQVVAEELQVGGNLKMGTYEFYVVYCDLLGNEMTQYSTPTNPISIFDDNNNILNQTQLDVFTNYAIKLKVKNLNTEHFKYYKVVCIERNNVDNTQSGFIHGIFPTTDNTIVYTSSGSSSDDFITTGNISIKRRIDFNKLNLIKPTYDKAETTMVSGNRLWHKGLSKKEEINLQPVVNLFSGLMEWQTVAAKETLYKSAIANSKYKGYMRDEVQPFGIRFYFKDGDYSAVFPMVGRPSTQTERELFILNSGALKDGVKYVIHQLETGDNFSNVGFSSEGTPFTANGTLPTSWSNGTYVYEFSASSINANTPSCTTSDRKEKWQFVNTAEEIGTCVEIETGVETVEQVRKTCTVENVVAIPAGSTTIELFEDYTNLQNYLEDNPDEPIAGITEYLEEEYPEIHCQPTFESGCVDTELESYKNTISTVVNETVVKIEAQFPEDYTPLKSPDYCDIYVKKADGEYSLDLKFMSEHMHSGFYPPPGDDIREFANVIFRDYSFTNEGCSFPEDMVNISSPSDNVLSYFHNYRGADDLAGLQTNKTTFPSLPEYSDKVHKGGLWYKALVNGRTKFFLEISKLKSQGHEDYIINNIGNPKREVRLSFFNKCSDASAFYSTKVKLAIRGLLLRIDVDYVNNSLKISDGISPPVIISVPNVFSNGSFIVAVDDPIYVSKGVEDWEATPDEQDKPLVLKVRTAPADGCYSIVTRDVMYTSAIVSWDSIIVDKQENYVSACTFFLPNVDECDPKPFKRGRFAYWESTEQYPDNAELYDSSKLKIKFSDLEVLSESRKNDFLNYYTSDGTVNSGGNYTLKEDTNLTCKNIRHPKFPDNIVAPFMYDESGLQKFAETVIFPLGVTLDSSVVTSMLNVALANNLLTQKEYDNIEGYEILRGDNSISKSVIASGLGYDMYNYEKEDREKWWYANFPFNDLGKDKFHTTTKERTELIAHPYNSQGNHMYSFLSPDLFLTKPVLPTELSLSGYQFGSASQSIEKVEEHPKYTILGSKARSLASTLATLEVVLEGVIEAGELTSRQWATFGTSSGFSLGLAGAAIVAAGYVAQGFLKVGKYRYEWLRIFRDLGSSYNFAHMTVGVGKYNRFLKNDINTNNNLRGLSIKKYLNNGMFNIVDKNDGVRVNVNNWLREDSVLISTGESYKFQYPSDYIDFDNNNNRSSKSSKILSSDVGCETGLSSIRDIASPYFTMKNYIPDQWGTVDSIKWLTTNYIFKVGEDNNCSPILGGTVCISPFSWKRKTPLFRATGFELPDRLPFNYSEQRNIAHTRFYIDYEVDTEYSGLVMPFPDIDSDYNLDCQTGNRRFYVKPPSKIYLYSYGIVNFLVESEINCHFRYARKERTDWFYPQVSNVVDWVQEKNTPINEPNTFYYNNTYSFPVSNTPYKYLDITYNKEVWRKRNLQPNAVIYSEMDNNENDLTDPWRVYKPINWYEYRTNLGKLINLKDIESQQFFAMFENGLILNNAIDTLAERATTENRETGLAGIFAQRPLEFKTTDLGFAGTQNTEVCSTPFGHIFADAKRGRVFQIDQNGKNLEVISEDVQGQPTNMKQWFREHLPFKILKYFPEIDTDNKFKGLGLNMWYDDRNTRVFVTKRDYKVTNTECLKYEEGIGFYEDCSTTEIICPNGYSFNEETQMCEKTILTPAVCVEPEPVERVMFNFYNRAIVTCGGELIDFSTGSQNQAKCAYILPLAISCGGGIHSGTVFYINGDIQVGTALYASPSATFVYTSFSGNVVADTTIITDFSPGIPPGMRFVITVVDGIVTSIIDFNTLPTC